MDRTLLSGWPVVIEQPIAWGDMDSYGHVNNVMYFRYFENARLEYFRRLGWAVAVRPSGIGPIVHSTQCRFRRPLDWPDRIAVGARVRDMSDDRFTLEHQLISEKLGAVAAEGWSIIVTYDYAAGTKAAIPDELRRRIVELEGRPL
ncbi:MAG: acyl-CoA thioesterase [Gemmataceae bacterium]|nr:acyl-CoA thioesterase [Gemmataceae bacterium]